MKIAYLCNSPIPSNIASSVQVMKMCQALARDHDLTLFCPPAASQALPATVYEFYGVEPTFKIRRLPQPGSWADRTLQTARLLRWELALRRFDLVYARCNAWRPYRVHRIKRPLIVEAHLLRQASRTTRLLGCRWVRGLVVVSDSLRRDYSRTYGLDPADVLTAHNGADPARPSRPAGLPGSSPVRCGYVGNLYEGKGVEIIIPLARQCSQVDFHVFGGTANQVTAWQDTIGAPSIPNLWFHGSLPPADTDAARLACDMLIAPYQEAGQEVWRSPLKIFEYMAAGKAIIASDLPALREMLRDGENAVLVPPADLQAWARAVGDLAADATERQQLGARAQEDFVEQHSWQARAHRIMDAFAPSQAKTERLGQSAQHIEVQRAVR
jgi:glycosyltransferase involved in cell wall biosynthesis